MPFNCAEKIGIAELLEDKQNVHVLMQLARSVTGNVCEINSTTEALHYLCIHIDDAATLLKKRHITKQVLFKYLTRKSVAITTEITKETLINKVLEYWNRETNGAATDNDIIQHVENTEAQSPIQNTESQFPIHLMAHKFSEWFFQNYNENSLIVKDFWSDARLLLQIAANDRTDVSECEGADDVIKLLMQSKKQFEFYFNPNLTHAGVQGRMDVHGLVLVLVCGTLHVKQNSVGVFECNFGLVRDPFADNNWKVKTIQCVLRSQGVQTMPSLQDSSTLRDLLSLQFPTGELQ